MSSKNFMAYGDAETVLTGFANAIKGKAKTYILNTESTDVSSTTFIPLANISTFPTCEVGDIIVLKVNANYTFNTTAGGYWMFKINNIGNMMRLLWADESDFNQDLPKGSCVVFVYNHNILFDDFLTVASFDVKNFDPSTVVQKSQTSGLLKNDGTVDTTTYASEAGTESLINSTVGWTGKNQFDGFEGSQSSNNVTFTSIDADKSVTVSTNGTASAMTTFSKDITAMAVDTTTEYILSGCPAGGLGGGYQLDIIASNITMSSIVDTGDGVKFSFPVVPTGNQKYYIRIRIANGASVNKTFYPMIRLATVTDPTYEPYHKSVEECLEDINDKLSYLEQTVTLSTSASTTVTFTDSSITANSFIEYACSVWDLVPESITGAAGSCTIVLPKVDSAQSVTVRIYVR